MLAVGKWLAEMKPEELSTSPVVSAVLQMFLRVPFGVDQLVAYKFGRVIKKIAGKHRSAGGDEVAERVRSQATQLFDVWSALATQCDSAAR